MYVIDFHILQSQVYSSSSSNSSRNGGTAPGVQVWGGRVGGAEEEEPGAAAATQAARARVVAALHTKHLTSTLVPVAVQLRRLLQAWALPLHMRARSHTHTQAHAQKKPAQVPTLVLHYQACASGVPHVHTLAHAQTISVPALACQ